MKYNLNPNYVSDGSNRLKKQSNINIYNNNQNNEEREREEKNI